MKFVLASYGTRGDVEPCVAVGRELLRRGHDVQMAVPPELLAFTREAGLPAVAYGPEMGPWLDVNRAFWTFLFRNFWKVPALIKLWHELWEPVTQCRVQMIATLKPLAEGADLLLTGLAFEEAAANVAEYLDVPLATLHYFPIRSHGRLLPFLPPPLTRSAMSVFWWLSWLVSKKAENEQRRELGLPNATSPAARRITQRGSLEIQAYDPLLFPGLEAEWAKWNGQRPFVGALAMELPTGDDEDALSWIASGKPPIFFGFGSFMVESPTETIRMIGEACGQLGERALVGAGWSDFSEAPQYEHLKVVGVVNYAAIFPACRAVVHHGGAGTTALGLRAGVPQLILSTLPDQPFWGAQVKRLKVGTTRRLSTTTRESLIADLRRILSPQVVTKARQIAAETTQPADGIAATADLVEDFARSKCKR